MSDSTDEYLSSLIDDEVDATDCRRLSKLLCEDVQRRSRWERHHLISDALRSNLPPAMNPGFADRVRQAIEQEPAILAPQRRRAELTPATRWVAGLTVAASVAAVSVFGVRFLNQDPSLGTTQLAQMPPSSEFVHLAESTDPASTVSLTQIKPPLINPQSQPLLDQYLVNHHQQAFGAPMQGVMPYARIVAYPSTVTEQPGQ